jgi:hypothetical protein
MVFRRLDEYDLGFEDPNTGLALLQQVTLLLARCVYLSTATETFAPGKWDELVKQQRRAKLLAWPETRPPYLLSFSEKLFKVKVRVSSRVNGSRSCPHHFLTSSLGWVTHSGQHCTASRWIDCELR